ncbi:hypothetical protein TSUD_94150 [Trifolium subterraneum]|uniref:EF-hand domain-containing protein n=1 Tax=Trifolium subterraneum TaxID=3900 RepID=A0A2Z6NAF3_TRISU|nr:hypothetical protein TSUD_94150 [Trifolium subterraneum]
MRGKVLSHLEGVKGTNIEVEGCMRIGGGTNRRTPPAISLLGLPLNCVEYRTLLVLGVKCGGDCLAEFGDEQEITNMFENGVSLEEVKEAFNVFDENKDGFIEAAELKRVLCCLGLKRDFMECKKMINVVDQNGDELIDHYEFIKLIM